MFYIVSLQMFFHDFRREMSEIGLKLMDFCSIFMIVRVDVGILNKRGENMKGIITWNVLY